MKKLLALSVILALSVLPGHAQPGGGFSWQEASVYQVKIADFLNGDPDNDHAYGRGLDLDRNPTGVFDASQIYGGDFAGLIQKIESGYFEALGVNVLRISNPFEQVHGKFGKAAPRYSFDGRNVLDFTSLDESLGSEADFRRFIETAHAHGLRVIMDVALDAPGPPTPEDMARLQFGAIAAEDWQSGRPGQGQTWGEYLDNVIDWSGPDSLWARWWGPGWVRTNLPGYLPCEEGAAPGCGHDSAVFRTDSNDEVDLPAFLIQKWGAEQTASERSALNSFFDRTGYPRTPAYYLVKWISDWTERFGIDGYHLEDPDEIAPAVWAALKNEGVRALMSWRSTHAGNLAGDTRFWLASERGEAEPETYFGHGIDALVDPGDAAGSAPDLDSLFVAYSDLDDGPGQWCHAAQAGDEAPIDVATRLLLSPGAIQMVYGIETGRFAKSASSNMGMNWETINESNLAHWEKLGQFRMRHPAIALGTHQSLSDDPYTFHRHYAYGGTMDDVVIVIGAKGKTQLNVSRAFPNDALIRDAYTGSVALVSYGLVAFSPAESGVMLLEEVK